MKLTALLLASMVFLVAPLDSRAGGHEGSIETAIEDAYRAYVQDFIDNDFEGIASRFRLPAVFEAETPQIFQTRDDLIRFYKDAKANIQEGYSHSTLDSIEIRPITEQIYSADVVYRRLDADDEVIHRGRSWKMFLLSPYSNR